MTESGRPRSQLARLKPNDSVESDSIGRRKADKKTEKQTMYLLPTGQYGNTVKPVQIQILMPHKD